MSLRALLILCLVAATAHAKPKKVKQPVPKSPAAKLDKKQLEIERHEWMAQYYICARTT